MSASIERTWLMPALLTSTSTVSKRSRQAATARSPASGSVMSSASHETVRASPSQRSAAVLERLLAAADEQHAGALGDELARHVQADAARAAGDDAGAICEAEVHRRSQILPVAAVMSR